MLIGRTTRGAQTSDPKPEVRLARSLRNNSDESGRSAVSSHVTGVEDGASSEFGANEWLVDEMYEKYIVDKNSVEKTMYFSYISSTSHSLAPNSLEAPSSTPVTWLDTADRPLSFALLRRLRASRTSVFGSLVCAPLVVRQLCKHRP